MYTVHLIQNTCTMFVFHMHCICADYVVKEIASFRCGGLGELMGRPSRLKLLVETGTNSYSKGHSCSS